MKVLITHNYDFIIKEKKHDCWILSNIVIYSIFSYFHYGNDYQILL